MFDIAISDDGDLILDESGGDIKTVSDDNLRVQAAFCRIKSVKRDWAIDHIGADIEELIGEPNIEPTKKACADKIFEALTVDSLFAGHEVFIEATTTSNVSFNLAVYLKNIQQNTSTLINTSLDLVKGISIRIGDR